MQSNLTLRKTQGKARQNSKLFLNNATGDWLNSAVRYYYK